MDNIKQIIPVPSVDTNLAAQFMEQRADWFQVAAIDDHEEGWDVWLRIDGSYVGEGFVTKKEMVDYFVRWLSTIVKADPERGKVDKWHRKET